ncbi:MAG TPA: hypothetical protein VMV92_00720 [Streptosporangiaceae bacterium]|nr:hypothetical protein [Streptosporangiaceae bacterium]
MSDTVTVSPLGEADPETGEIVIRAKWTIDGAATLAEAAQKAREFAEYLLDLESQGYALSGPVGDDYGFCVRP